MKKNMLLDTSLKLVNNVLPKIETVYTILIVVFFCTIFILSSFDMKFISYFFEEISNKLMYLFPCPSFFVFFFLGVHTSNGFILALSAIIFFFRLFINIMMYQKKEKAFVGLWVIYAFDIICSLLVLIFPNLFGELLYEWSQFLFYAVVFCGFFVSVIGFVVLTAKNINRGKTA